MERGYSNFVRIGPDVARAYAGFLEGNEAKVDMTAAEWRRLPVVEQRACSLLALIGANFDELSAVGRALGEALPCPSPGQAALVTRTLAVRLVDYCKATRSAA